MACHGTWRLHHTCHVKSHHVSYQVLSELLGAIVRILEAMLEEVVVGNRNRAFGLVFTRLGAEEVVAHGSKLQLIVASGGKRRPGSS